MTIVNVAWRGRSGRSTLQPLTRFACGLMACGCLIRSLRVQSCPHATYGGVGPVLVPVRGHACNNSQPFRLLLPALRLRFTGG